MRNTIYYIQYTPKRAFRWLTATRRRKILSSILSILFVLISARFLFFAGGAKAAWWSGDGTGSWTKRKQLTITNNSGDNLASGTTVAVTINAKDLTTAGKLQDDCDDLRVIYDTGSTQTELTRYISVAGNATCGASGAAKVHFPLQAALNDGGSNSSTDYYIYYGNPSATAPTSTVDAFDTVDDNALLVCPFDGTTECINGDGAEDPTTESGAIRYGGAKSAMQFDGVNGNDTVTYTWDEGVLATGTLEFYFKTPNQISGSFSDELPIMEHEKSGGDFEGEFALFIDDIDGEFELSYNNGTGFSLYSSNNTTWNPNQWYHIAFVWNGIETKLYIDGSLDNTYTISDSFFIDSEILTLGHATGFADPYYFDGTLDEMRISNVPRYISSFSPSTSPFVRDEYTTLLYHFDENGDDPRDTGKAIDDSGNGNHGTITGAKYVAGLIGVDASTSDTGNADGGNTYAGHEGIFIEEGTTNKVPNPSFEHATYNTNWTASGGTPSENTTEPYYKFGSKSYQMVLASATDVNIYDGIDAGNTNTHTLSAYVYRGTSGYVGGIVNNTVAQLYFNGTAQSTTTYTDMGGGWWRLTYSAAAGSGSQDYGVTVTEDSGTLYIDGVQLEEKSYATTYTDGSLGTSYSWSGTANDSTSSRSQENILYPTSSNLNASAGTVSFWIKPDWDGDDGVKHVMFDLPRDGGSNNNRMRIEKYSNNTLRVQIFDSTGDNRLLAYAVNSTNLPLGTWAHVVASWDSANDVELYLNGSSVGSLSGTGAGYPSTLNSGFAIGSKTDQGHVSYSNFLNAQIDNFRVYDDQLTSAEVTDLYYSSLVGHSEDIEVDAFGEEKGQRPVAIWHFDASSGPLAQDSSTYGNHLTLDNANWETQSVGARSTVERYLSFDGSTSSASRSGVLREFNFGTGSFSMGGWFRHSSTISGTDTILSRYGATGYKVYMNSSGYICASVDDDSTWGPDDEVCSTTTQGSLADSSWHHFEAVVDRDSSPTVARIYIDGIQANYKETLTATATVNSSELIAVGADASDGTPDYWDGDIDELIVYPYARTADQVKADVLGGSKSTTLGAHTEDWLTDGLVGYWKMDETSAVTSVTDYSGNGNDGSISLWGAGNTATSSARLAGKFGGGIDFDGEDDYLNMGDLDPYTGPINVRGAGLTYTAWINVDDFSADEGHILGKWDNDESRNTLGTSTSSSIFFSVVSGGAGPFPISAPAGILSTNTWYHVAVTFEDFDNTVTLYVDGEIVKRGDIIGGFSGFGDDDFTIGQRADGNDEFNGTIDEARVYNRILSPAEVQDLYEWAPGPVGYWPMDEGTGTSTTYDKSGNAYNATLTGSMTEDDWVSGKFGAALDFDGSDDDLYINASDAFNGFEGGATQSFWIYPRGNTSGTRHAFGTPGVCVTLFELSGNNYRIEFNCGFVTQTGGWLSGFVIPINQWTHVAITYNWDSVSNVPTLYINGINQTFTEWQTPQGNSPTMSTELYIGGQASFLPSIIDEVKMYNYARTQEQIIEDMNAGHPAPGSPVGSAVGHWKFDEGYGDTLSDTGTGGYNGDIGGSGQTCPTSTDTTCPNWSNDGKYGKALDFEVVGTNDYVKNTTANFLSAATSGTITAWLKPESFPNTGMVFSSSDEASDNYHIDFYLSSSTGLPTIYQKNGGSPDIISSNNSLSTGSWSHVAWISTGTEYKIFINGLEQELTITGGSNSGDWFADIDNRDNFTLGVIESTSISRPYDGLMDEVKIYNFALTSDQVKVEYNQGSAQVFGSTSIDSSNNPLYSSTSSYCVPGTTCNPPVAEWLFDESSGTSAQDTSENANTGTLGGDGSGTDLPTWTPHGKDSSWALDFDDIDDYVQIAQNTSLPIYDDTSYSISAWIKAQAVDWGSIYTEANISNNLPAILIQTVSGGNIRVAIRGDDGVFDLDQNSTTIAADDGWHHVTWTDNNGTAILYIDGVQDASDFSYSRGTLTLNTSTVGAWRRLAGITNLLKGIADSVRIYDYVRTPAQIAWSYNRGAPVGWWKFDECQGNTAYDSGTGGNNGTITEGGSGDNDGGVGTCSSGAGDEMWDNGTNGKRNASLDFDGTDDYTSVSDNSVLKPESVSVSAWVKLDSLTSSTQCGVASNMTQYIVFKRNSRTTSFESYALVKVAGSYQFFVAENGGTQGGAGSITAPSTGEWVHLVGTFDQPDIKLYINGKLEDSDTHNYVIDDHTRPLFIGRSGECGGAGEANYDSYFDGQIDDVRIYNYALTQKQINDIYNSGAVHFGP